MTPRSPLPPRLALVGCGAIAETYYLPALANIPELRPGLLLVDPNTTRTSMLSSRYGIASTATDYREVIGSVDGVIIAVPHHLHYSIAREMLENGIHVLCEKPLTEDPSQARDLCERAARSGLSLLVNNTQRLLPSRQAVKNLVQNGDLGTISFMAYHQGEEFSWPSVSGFYTDRRVAPRGVLLDLGAHALDLMCWWLGGTPTVELATIDAHGGIEAVSSTTLKYGAARCEVRLSRLQKLANRFTVVGSSGSVVGDVYDPYTITLTRPGRRPQVIAPERRGDPDLSTFGQTLLENFAASIQGKSDPMIPGSAVIPSLELIDEAYRIARPFPMPWYDRREEISLAS